MEDASIQFDRYYRYEELTQQMRRMEAAYPDLCRVYSIGKSYEGRDLWLAEITNTSTGSPESKPALYVDGNIHAGEVTGCTACLHLMHHVLTQWGSDDRITHIVDTRTLYVLPRVNPDGAELYLSTPDMLRSSTRPNPDYRLEKNHLYPQDINGDGEILLMRIEDPNGSHRVSDLDERLMVARGPGESGGQYYRIYPEGMIHDYDGGEIREAPSPWDIDSNRNFPASWSPTQAGGGRYPLSEPETRAVAEFILEKPNICMAHAFHTKGGIILRPSCSRPDDELDAFDVRSMDAIAEKGTKCTGYPVRSAYRGFNPDEAKPKHGVFLDWLYDHLGVIGYITELWDKYSRAGIDRWSWPHGTPVPENKLVRLLEWHDEEGLDCFVDWHEFEHPQLGTVELGGFLFKSFQQNVPFKLLEDECDRAIELCLEQAAATPRLEIEDVQVQDVGGTVRIRAFVRNDGYLPTSGTRRAAEVDAIDEVVASLTGEGIELVSGHQRQSLGHIEGHAVAGRGFIGGADGYGPPPPYGLRCAEWVIRAAAGTEVTIDVTSDRAGSAQRTITLSQCRGGGT